MVEFTIEEHAVQTPGVRTKGTKIVQVMSGGRLLCTITPSDSGRGIRVISTHFDNFVVDVGPIPVINMEFDPKVQRPFIRGGKIDAI